MIQFCGQDYTTIDSNCRIKFSPRVLNDFLLACDSRIVLHCLPEGALAVYPEPVYVKMRQKDSESEKKAGESMLFRRKLRRFGALSSYEKISRQGRITIPQGFRELTSLTPGINAVVVGVEIGVEIWNAEIWTRELQMIQKHLSDKGELEMEMDLNTSNIEGEKC
jgi:DNA-binding transcriptional regulator/RsmH inhibitor MraZ